MDPINPYRGRVVDLVNPYAVRTEGTEYAVQWLRDHPGRWALVGEDGMGFSREMARGFGLNALYRGAGDRIYAQVPHPEAEPLAAALARWELRPQPNLLELLPWVTRDPFNWTEAELAEAAQIARDNLFPVADRKEP